MITKSKEILHPYPVSRVPIISKDCFEISDFNPHDKTEDERKEEKYTRFVMYVYDKLQTQKDKISVAELRLTAGLHVEIEDYMWGFDIRALDYVGTTDPKKIEFHPMHLIRLVYLEDHEDLLFGERDKDLVNYLDEFMNYED